jgi:heavy metal translocating P-type ATPase
MYFCALCDNDLPSNSIVDGDRGFCCHGCHAVFNILTTTNQLTNFQETAVFQQALRSGLISNPALLEQIRRNRPNVPENEMEKLHLEVGEMWCPACAEVIRLVLLQEKGVRNCVVDYATDLASIEFAPRFISKDRIQELIKSLGYHPASLDTLRSAVSFSLYLRFIIAAFCALNVMMLAYPIYATYFDYDSQDYGQLFAWLSLITSIPVVTYSAWPIFRRFLTGFKVGLFGMETLVVIGVATAFGLSVHELMNGGTRVYFDSMTVIITFVLLGKIIEAKAKFSAKDALIHLTRSLPRRGRKRLTDGSLAFVSVKEMTPGDIIVAFQGEKIVLDGIVIEGEGACDESLMTGETLPVLKTNGISVLGGSILLNGSLTFRICNVAQESALYKIIDMVQQDIGHKSTYIRAADYIVHRFVPFILLFALGTAAVCWLLGITDPGKSIDQTAIIRAISVLLISCPCAIGIAAPLAESRVMSGLAALGAIVRNRGCLTLLGKETVFVFDKTGTVTEGRFTVLSGLDKLSAELRSLLKGLTSQSNHLIANAIARSIEELPTTLTQIEEFTGLGMKGFCQEGVLLLGSAEFMRQQGIVLREELLDNLSVISSTVHVAFNRQHVAQLCLGDQIRENVKDVIHALSPAKTILLSGDSVMPVEEVARACAFNSWCAGCTPLQKREYIENLRKEGQIVCMVGDGINDAPALTAANIGISVVSATDISIQVSDLLLTTDRLQVIPKIRALALKGQAIIRQNLFWAFFYNVVGIGLAAFGVLSPIFAAFAMVASSLMVLFNAKRI